MLRPFISWALIAGLVSTAACQSEWLSPHNEARSAVGVPNLVWDNDLAAYASNYASNLAGQGCILVHSSNNPNGENLFQASWASTPADAVNAWIAEEQYYDYNSNSCASDQVCGHYTQVVWRNSQRLGCASASCSSGGTVSVCEYNPPGNYIGEKPY